MPLETLMREGKRGLSVSVSQSTNGKRWIQISRNTGQKGQSNWQNIPIFKADVEAGVLKELGVLLKKAQDLLEEKESQK